MEDKISKEEYNEMKMFFARLQWISPLRQFFRPSYNTITRSIVDRVEESERCAEQQQQPQPEQQQPPTKKRRVQKSAPSQKDGAFALMIFRTEPSGDAKKKVSKNHLVFFEAAQMKQHFFHRALYSDPLGAPDADSFIKILSFLMDCHMNMRSNYVNKDIDLMVRADEHQLREMGGYSYMFKLLGKVFLHYMFGSKHVRPWNLTELVGLRDAELYVDSQSAIDYWREHHQKWKLKCQVSEMHLSLLQQILYLAARNLLRRAIPNEPTLPDNRIYRVPCAFGVGADYMLPSTDLTFAYVLNLPMKGASSVPGTVLVKTTPEQDDFILARYLEPCVTETERWRVLHYFLTDKNAAIRPQIGRNVCVILCSLLGLPEKVVNKVYSHVGSIDPLQHVYFVIFDRIVDFMNNAQWENILFVDLINHLVALFVLHPLNPFGILDQDYHFDGIGFQKKMFSEVPLPESHETEKWMSLVASTRESEKTRYALSGMDTLHVQELLSSLSLLGFNRMELFCIVVAFNSSFILPMQNAARREDCLCASIPVTRDINFALNAHSLFPLFLK